MELTKLILRAEQTHTLTEDELTALLGDSGINETLFTAADHVRCRYVGNDVHLRALIEFTNICRNNCKYCGLQHQNRNLPRYRLSQEDILRLAQKAAAEGYKTVVLQGGEDSFFTANKLAEIIARIKQLDLAVTVSFGEMSRQDYQILKDAGANRYLLRIETTDPALYAQYHPGMSLAKRKRCLQDLKELGYEVGTGVLVGLPGQTLRSLAKDLLFIQSIDADMIGLGPFIPNPQTPLKNAPQPQLTPALKVMALARLLCPDANIPATTAMETVAPDGRILALQSGANVVMPNITEGEARLNYALYPGKACAGEDPSKCRGCLTAKLALIGRSVSTGYGYRRKRI